MPAVCYREAISWCASTGGISAEMIRDLMLQATEKRFWVLSYTPADSMALGRP